MKKIMVTAVLSVMTGLGVHGQGASGKLADYSKLSVDNMPPIQIIVKKAAEVSTSGDVDVNTETRRIRNSNWLPRFRVFTKAQSLPHYDYGSRDIESEFNYYQAGDPGALHTSTYRIRGTSYGQLEPTSSQYYSDWYVQARWTLGKVVLDRNEIYAREMIERSSYYKKGTVDNVVKAYSELMDLLIEKVEVDDDPYLERDIVAAAVELDFLTGYFLTDLIGELKDEPTAGESAPVVTKPDVSTTAVKKKEPREKKKTENEVDPQLDPSSPLYELGEALPEAPVEDVE